MNDAWPSIVAAAEALGVSERTAWRYLREGRIKRGKVNGRQVFLPVDGTDSTDMSDVSSDMPLSDVRTSKESRRLSNPTVFDPVEQVGKEISVERSRLQLRDLRSAHDELDQREAAKAKRQSEEREHARQTAQQQVLAHERAVQEARRQAQREKAVRETQRRKAQIITGVLEKVVRGYWNLRYTASALAKAQAIEAIRTRLMPMDLEEMPHEEVIEIAEGIRDEVYGPHFRAENQAKEAARVTEEERQEKAGLVLQASVQQFVQEREREEQAQREAQEQARQEQQARQQKQEQARQAKDARLANAKRIAEEVLREDAPHMSDFSRSQALRELQAAASDELSGNESQQDLKAIVDRILEPVLTKQRDTRKKELISHADRYASNQLDEAKELSYWDRSEILDIVKKELEKELDGSESKPDVEDVVEEILDAELD